MAPSIFDSSLVYSIYNAVVFWQPVLFSKWPPLSFVVKCVSYSCAEQFMTVVKGILFKDHRAVETIMSPDPSTHKRIGGGVRNFGSAAWDREEKCRVIWQLRQISAEPRHETSPFEHWQYTVGRSQPSGHTVGHWSPGGGSPRQRPTPVERKKMLGEAISTVRKPLATVRPG